MGGQIIRQKHLTFSIIFLLLCSFIALIAVSQQKTVGQLVAEKDKAFRELYTPPDGAWAVYEAAFDVLEARIQTVMTKIKAQRSIKISSTDPKENTLKVKGSSVLSKEI